MLVTLLRRYLLVVACSDILSPSLQPWWHARVPPALVVSCGRRKPEWNDNNNTICGRFERCAYCRATYSLSYAFCFDGAHSIRCFVCFVLLARVFCCWHSIIIAVAGSSGTWPQVFWPGVVLACFVLYFARQGGSDLFVVHFVQWSSFLALCE